MLYYHQIPLPLSLAFSSTVITSTNPVTSMSTVFTTMINLGTTAIISMNPSANSINPTNISTNSMITTSIGMVINSIETTTTAVNYPIFTISTDTLLLPTSPAKTTLADKNSKFSIIITVVANVCRTF